MMRVVKIVTLVACAVAMVAAASHIRRSGQAVAETTAASKPEVPAAGKEAPAVQTPLSPSRAAREEKAIQDARRQQLAEKEAALAAKEQELKKLSDKLESQLKAAEENKKQQDDAQKVQNAAKKKSQEEKRKKMIAMFKKMRPEQAGQMLDKLEEGLAISVLDQMDTKTVIKLVPFLNQPRVLKWINANLKGV